MMEDGWRMDESIARSGLSISSALHHRIPKSEHEKRAHGEREHEERAHGEREHRPRLDLKI